MARWQRARWWGSAATLGAMGVGVYLLAAPQRPDIVARVDGRPISAHLLWERLLQRGGRAVLRELIYDALLLQEAERQGIVLSEKEVAEEEKRFLQQFPSLESLEEWKQRHPQQWASVQETLRLHALFRRLVEAEVQVSEEEVAAYYREHAEEFREPEQVRAQGILVESRENAEALREALLQPEADFAALARQFSLDPATREQGGDMGWVRPGMYSEAVEKVLFRLKPGEISEPVETPDGFFLLRILERKPARQMPLEEVRERLRQQLKERKRREVESTYLERLRRRAHIEVLWPELMPLWEE